MAQLDNTKRIPLAESILLKVQSGTACFLTTVISLSSLPMDAPPAPPNVSTPQPRPLSQSVTLQAGTEHDNHNHTACTAQFIVPPVMVAQPADHPYNIYRFDAVSPSYLLKISRYLNAGQALVYEIMTDDCRTANKMNVRFRSAANITSFETFETTLEGIFSPGSSYLLAVYTSGVTTSRPYTLTLNPILPTATATFAPEITPSFTPTSVRARPLPTGRPQPVPTATAVPFVFPRPTSRP